jgi:hypothetical protein
MDMPSNSAVAESVRLQRGFVERLFDQLTAGTPGG